MKTQMDDSVYMQIIKDCFWEYDMTPEAIGELADSDDFRKKMFLYQKIMENSTHLLRDLEIFSQEDLRKLQGEYQIPPFKREFLEKRKKIVDFIFFRKEIDIPELRWSP